VHEVNAVEQVNEPGEDVTVYEVIAALPSTNGADHDTDTEPSSTGSARTSTGASGTVDGVAAADSSEAEPVPRAFVAVTVNVYAVPLVKPVIVHGFTRTHDTGVCAVAAMYGVTV
jgi:hypothetical protein